MEIFDNIAHADTGPALYTETSFAYYNRSARVGVARIRALLEGWIQHYPSTERLDLRARFRADFDSAFFELFLHELMRRLHIGVTVHPILPFHVRSRPDFGLNDSASEGYLEARVAHDESASESRRRKLLHSVYDSLNGISIPDYFIQIRELELLSEQQPSARVLSNRLRVWIESLDYSALVKSEPPSLDALPLWAYDDGYLRLVVRAIPVSERHRGDPSHRPVGILPMESRWGGSANALRKALRRKGTKYGQMDRPYIIAVNLRNRWGSDRMDQMAALFGSEEFTIGLGQEAPEMNRKPNGFWRGPKGPVHTRVSAVLFCEAAPWNVDRAEVCLYHNPWAAHPYGGRLTILPQAVPKDNKMSWEDGVALGSLFDLHSDWTGE